MTLNRIFLCKKTKKYRIDVILRIESVCLTLKLTAQVFNLILFSSNDRLATDEIKFAVFHVSFEDPS